MVLALTTALLLLLGNEIVVLLYGAKWAAAGTTLRILSLLVFCRGYAVLISPLLIAIRGNAPDAKIKLVEAAIFLALLYPLTTIRGGGGGVNHRVFGTMINRFYFAVGASPNAGKLFCGHFRQRDRDRGRIALGSLQFSGGKHPGLFSCLAVR